MEEVILNNVEDSIWEYGLDKTNSKRYRALVIERYLSKGDFFSLKWLFNRFDCVEINDVVSKSNFLSSNTKNFWEIVFASSRLLNE